jgi:hypothetical protein
MYEEKIRHINIELKIISLDLERISARLEDNNRSIKDILIKSELNSKQEELKELIDFNRFLLQKHKEKIGDKLHAEEKLKSILKEENKVEFKLIKDEKRMENFILTIDNNIEFNSSHPYFNDPSFVRDLLDEYLKLEDYERCASLKKHLEEINLIAC